MVCCASTRYSRRNYLEAAPGDTEFEWSRGRPCSVSAPIPSGAARLPLFIICAARDRPPPSLVSRPRLGPRNRNRTFSAPPIGLWAGVVGHHACCTCVNQLGRAHAGLWPGLYIRRPLAGGGVRRRCLRDHQWYRQRCECDGGSRRHSECFHWRLLSSGGHCLPLSDKCVASSSTAHE